ncbi:class I SAM-dependent methyltransferase [Candidatus Woesebacteria bacterium]|nr:class I SAM-dependent methyltransferase [Candidatus Woesebacteria bacterium]
MSKKTAAQLHSMVPPDWYYKSIRENILQNYWHNRRFEEVAKLIEPVKGQILDIGSADGVFTRVILEKSGAERVIGIDVLPPSVKWASRHWNNSKLKFMVADAHSLPFESNSFDAVVALEVLEHVYEPKKVLSEIKRVLKKNGYAIFLVPTDSLMFRTGWELVWTKTRGRIWNETHVQTYRNDYLVKLSNEAGFKVVVNKKFILGMLQAIKVRKE